MRNLLKLIFILFLAAIAWGTVTAMFEGNTLAAWRELWPHAWFKATLVDTYCAFLTIYAWIFYKESCWFLRIFWLVLILCLGTFAYASYILIQLFRLKPDEPLSSVLLRKSC